MNPRACCAPTGRVRRGLLASRWLVPGALLALLPKCPLCFAAYFAAATGIGLSAATASHVRTWLTVACVAALVVLAARAVGRRVGPAR